MPYSMITGVLTCLCFACQRLKGVCDKRATQSPYGQIICSMWHAGNALLGMGACAQVNSMAGSEVVREKFRPERIPQQSGPAPEGFDSAELEPSIERARLIRRQRAAEGSAASERAAVLALAAELRRHAHAWRMIQSQLCSASCYIPIVLCASPHHWHDGRCRELHALQAQSAALPRVLHLPMAALEVDAGARAHCAGMAEAADTQGRRHGLWEVAAAECAVSKLRRALLCGGGERLEVAAFRHVPGLELSLT